eukprot:4820464-Pleurochrysis_carterae.AAC.1
MSKGFRTRKNAGDKSFSISGTCLKASYTSSNINNNMRCTTTYANLRGTTQNYTSPSATKFAMLCMPKTPGTPCACTPGYIAHDEQYLGGRLQVGSVVDLVYNPTD